MERVAFLIEATGERIRCMLNPESLSVSRTAGLRPRRSIGGPLAGPKLSDSPLLLTGGGVTEMILDLLFDISVIGSSIDSDDIRDFTRPLRELAENHESSVAGQRRRPPFARFLWGMAWNIGGVVTAIAERLESFTAEGIPRRSWLRLRFVRVEEQSHEDSGMHGKPKLSAGVPTSTTSLLPSIEGQLPFVGSDDHIHEMIGDSDPSSGTAERLDEIAYRYYGDATLWRLIAVANGIRNPLKTAVGTRLIIPSIARQERGP